MKKTIGILYIATGRYIIFWKDFFESSEKYFLSDSQYEKHYYVFTDAKNIDYGDKSYVHVIYQKPLPWPYITLDRFSIFQNVRSYLKNMDYIYFFNSNMVFLRNITDEILPTKEKSIVLVKHPGFYNKPRSEYTYETNKKSLACIAPEEGTYYFMGGLNGGKGNEYLNLVDECKRRIDIDKKKGIVAIWHDESHLNRYAIDHSEVVKILEPSYGYPEGWNIPFEPLIMIRDKSKYGGHAFLRNQKKGLKSYLKGFFNGNK